MRRVSLTVLGLCFLSLGAPRPMGSTGLAVARLPPGSSGVPGTLLARVETGETSSEPPVTGRGEGGECHQG